MTLRDMLYVPPGPVRGDEVYSVRDKCLRGTVIRVSHDGTWIDVRWRGGKGEWSQRMGLEWVGRVADLVDAVGGVSPERAEMQRQINAWGAEARAMRGEVGG